ncbi:hypothetical protein G6F55_014212 [Rhizopus delemar]|nr:hypothetical protein G6F23_015130 [Rhizopus arrhizus]KAG1436464.1 hypothetical protein G6F55_014212 [Rhizopus delemar]
MRPLLFARHQRAAAAGLVAVAGDRLAVDDQGAVTGHDRAGPVPGADHPIADACHGAAFDIGVRGTCQYRTARLQGVTYHDQHP